jgi:hypothetical protein
MSLPIESLAGFASTGMTVRSADPTTSVIPNLKEAIRDSTAHA